MPTDPWDAMARWRDERMGDRGDLWHRGIIDPAVRRLVGPVRGRRILELACGNGYLAREFARRGARIVVGIDRSRATIARAQARERARPTGARFLCADVARLLRLPRGGFDLVVANMALMDIADLAGTLREARRLVTDRGRLVFSICHPCFDTDADSMWVVERGLATFRQGEVVWRKVRGYRDESRRLVPWAVAADRTVRTPAYQRTLATYARALYRAGFTIARMEEPTPSREVIAKSPQGPYLVEIPLHLVVEAIARPLTRPASGTSERTSPAADRRSGSRARSRGTGSGRRGSTPGS